MGSPKGTDDNAPQSVNSDLPESVLVAEDDMLIARSVREMLESMGIRVVGLAPNGAQALEIAEKTTPDAAILDIRMPEVDGIEVAKTLWAAKRIPSVLLTAYGSDEYINGAVTAQAFGYVLKPVTPEGLRAALALAWANSRRQADRDTALADLRRTLDHRKLTERAKWRLVELGAMREPDAHLLLQRAARTSRRSLAEIAQVVLESDDPVAALRNGAR